MKTVLLGMNNPYGVDPKYALYPLPENSAGGRLYSMLKEVTGATLTQYRDGFDRRNLVAGPWSKARAREAADVLLAEAAAWSPLEVNVLVLGRQVWEALGLAPLPFLSRTGMWWAMPHPSGRNLWLNDPANRSATAAILASAYRGELA
jgi:hypothetical protein